VTLQPLHQFTIVPLFDLRVGGYDVSFSNSSLFMMIAVGLIYALFHYGMRSRALIPGRLQSAAEIFHEFVSNMVRDNASEEARPYFPFVFSLFMFVLFGNLVGLIPFAFTFTSHIVVTFALAAVVIVFVTILGLVKHGLHFFAYFLPSGSPLWLAPILIPIEIISYLTRPISLSIRLFANMMAGHTMLNVFGGFSAMMLFALGGLGLAVGVLPVLINIALIGFELLVAALQAYVFAILTCLYIRDAIHLH